MIGYIAKCDLSYNFAKERFELGTTRQLSRFVDYTAANHYWIHKYLARKTHSLIVVHEALLNYSDGFSKRQYWLLINRHRSLAWQRHGEIEWIRNQHCNAFIDLRQYCSSGIASPPMSLSNHYAYRVSDRRSTVSQFEGFKRSTSSWQSV